jgi:hypothetical protein
MNTQTKTCCFSLLTLLIPVLGGQALAAQSWQERRPPAPSDSQQRTQLLGPSPIYSGLHEDTVDHALDAQSEQGQSIKLVGQVEATDEAEEYADDDCD